MSKVKDLISVRRQIESEFKDHLVLLKKGEKNGFESLLLKIDDIIDDLIIIKTAQIMYNVSEKVDEKTLSPIAIYQDIYKLQLLTDERQAMSLVEKAKWWHFGKVSKDTKKEQILNLDREIFEIKERLDAYNNRELKNKTIKDIIKKYN